MALPTPNDLMVKKEFIWQIRNPMINALLKELHTKYHNNTSAREVTQDLRYHDFTTSTHHSYYNLTSDEEYVLENIGYQFRSFTTYYDIHECNVESGEGDLIYFQTHY